MLLIVSRKKNAAQLIAEMIRYSGVLCYASTPSEALSEISTMYRAVVLLDPEELPDAEGFVKKIRSYLSSIPIFALYEDKDFPAFPYYDASFSAATYSASFLNKLIDHSRAKNLKCIGDYRLAGINASPNLSSIVFFNECLKLTRTEAMILRFLIRSYPTPQKSKNIIKYVYKPSHAPEECSIRTHICSINKKFLPFVGFNLIKAIPSSGYIIYTPELREIYNL